MSEEHLEIDDYDYPVAEPIKVVKRKRYFNRILLRDNLIRVGKEMKMPGLWAGIRGFMQSLRDEEADTDEWEKFTLGRGVEENELSFQLLMEQVGPLLTQAGYDVDKLLDSCVQTGE